MLQVPDLRILKGGQRARSLSSRRTSVCCVVVVGASSRVVVGFFDATLKL